MEELFLEFLSKTLNTDKSGVAELIKSDDGIKPDALEKLLNKDKDRIKEIRDKFFNDGEKKARKEVLTSFEKELAEEYGIDADKKGKELVQAIIESKTTKDGKKFSDDDIKKHPYVLALENKLTKSIEDKDKEWTEKLTAKEQEWNREKTFATVKDKALQLFDSLNPILSSDAQKAANQKQILINELSRYGYDIVGDQIIINKAEGGVLEDDHSNKVKFADFVKNTASQYFDFKVSDEKSSPNGADRKDTGAKQGAYTGTIPKTRDEYTHLVLDKSIPLEQRAALKQAVDTKVVVLTD